MNKEQERKRIGARIAELRREQGMTQAALAERAGMQRTHIVRIEQGRYNVGVDALAAIGDALGRSIDLVERWTLNKPKTDGWSLY